MSRLKAVDRAQIVSATLTFFIHQRNAVLDTRFDGVDLIKFGNRMLALQHRTAMLTVGDADRALGRKMRAAAIRAHTHAGGDNGCRAALAVRIVRGTQFHATYAERMSLVVNERKRAEFRERQESRTRNHRTSAHLGRLGLATRRTDARNPGRYGEARERIARQHPFRSKIAIKIEVLILGGRMTIRFCQENIDLVRCVNDDHLGAFALLGRDRRILDSLVRLLKLIDR